MKHDELSWQAGDGLPLYAQTWRPAGQPRAAICLVHGLGEHSGRYHATATRLTGAGYAVIAFDLRGHGRSAGPRGHTPSYETLLDDIDLLLKETARCFPAVPRFLYGHSLGGNLAINYGLRRSTPLGGMIATGPWLQLAFDPPAYALTLGRAMNRLWPSYSRANGLEQSALSRDPAVVKAYQADPLVHDRISARLFVDTRDAGLWALAQAAQLPLPLLLMHGEADRLTSPVASEQFARQAPNCTLRCWPGFYHELHNEPEQEEVLSVMVDWLQVHS